MKTKMALFASGSLTHRTCVEDEKNGNSSSKEKGIPTSQDSRSGSCYIS